MKVNIPARIAKSKKKRITFISREAVQYLKQWLKYRGRFDQRASSRRSEYQFDLNDLRLFPFSNVNFSCKWNIACEKAGYGERDTNTKVDRIKFRPHNLRKFFRTHGNWSNPDVAEALIGHQAGLNAVYARLDQAVDLLVDGYLAAEPNLLVYENSKNMIELREKVDRQSDDIEQLVTSLSLKNVRLENQLGEQEVRISKLLDANQRLMETVLSQGERMDSLEREISGLSQRVFEGRLAEQRRMLVDRGLVEFSESLGRNGLVRVNIIEK